MSTKDLFLDQRVFIVVVNELLMTHRELPY